ncbi:hypothetical protein OJ996_17075 [Luteolibacter sp. GHJ8]|uniref:YIP1 family protein n=1 Tax=Luteolibacter rhizosphaerae TaxID=2989719 RepID=A0ABT3G749_9BACT|nr:hypothetical protein [Luteolibacter rhizosphaerae]MCW1915301.1 hypothetical protein [Luteolibacter rhizosphaerae]
MNADTPQPPPYMPQPPPARVEPPLPDKLDIRALFEALLRSPRGLVARLAEPGSGALLSFLGIAIISMIAFGLVLGSFAMGTQLWAAPLKITVGLLIAGIICYPSLYIFSCLAGSRAGAGQLASTLAGMLALAGLLLLGFAPAVWIFTQATDAFGFMGALGLMPWFVALCFGFRFLETAVGLTGATSRGPVFVWSCIFLMVTLQMTTSLRPILGRDSRFLTDEKKFFVQHWIESADKVLETRESQSQSPR